VVGDPRIFVRTLLPLLMPVVLLGGIYSGVFTPTEAAAVAALYALVLALFVYRALDWKALVSVLADSARSTAVVGSSSAAAFLFNTCSRPSRCRRAWPNGSVARPRPDRFLIVSNLVFLNARLPARYYDAAPRDGAAAPAGRTRGGSGSRALRRRHRGEHDDRPAHSALRRVAIRAERLTGTPVKAIVRELVPFILALIAVLFLITFVPSLVLALPSSPAISVDAPAAIWRAPHACDMNAVP